MTTEVPGLKAVANGAARERPSFQQTVAVPNLLETAKAVATGVWTSTVTAVIPDCVQKRQSLGVAVVAGDEVMASAPVERPRGQSELSALSLSRKAKRCLPEFVAIQLELVELVDLQIRQKAVVRQTQQGLESAEVQAMGCPRWGSALRPAYHQTLQAV